MRVSFISSLLLSALAAAEVQKPFQEPGWFDKAKAFLSSASNTPINAASAKAASVLVDQITYNNWREKILASDSNTPVQEWMVFFTGNASCFGRCDAADQAFNVSRAKSIVSHTETVSSGKLCDPDEQEACTEAWPS